MPAIPSVNLQTLHSPCVTRTVLPLVAKARNVLAVRILKSTIAIRQVQTCVHSFSEKKAIVSILIGSRLSRLLAKSSFACSKRASVKPTCS